jgi:hypothetical protein
MTPKEKAKDLVSKMYVEYKPSEDDASGVYVFYMNLEIAKRCALIAVDEIIKAMDNVMLPNPFKQYWNKVKQEIQAL